MSNLTQKFESKRGSKKYYEDFTTSVCFPINDTWTLFRLMIRCTQRYYSLITSQQRYVTARALHSDRCHSYLSHCLIWLNEVSFVGEKWAATGGIAGSNKEVNQLGWHWKWWITLCVWCLIMNNEEFLCYRYIVLYSVRIEASSLNLENKCFNVLPLSFCCAVNSIIYV